MKEVEFQHANGEIEIVWIEDSLADMRHIVRCRSSRPGDGNARFVLQPSSGSGYRIVFTEIEQEKP